MQRSLHKNKFVTQPNDLNDKREEWCMSCKEGGGGGGGGLDAEVIGK